LLGDVPRFFDRDEVGGLGHDVASAHTPPRGCIGAQLARVLEDVGSNGSIIMPPTMPWYGGWFVAD
jgi:hypothetical protein